jgi:hypothetical protein
MNFPGTAIDTFGIPSNFKGDVQIFHANNLSTISFQQWTKPRGTSMTYMICIGGGGGGGGAHSAASGTNGGGGGGGACSGISRLIIPSFILPDSLYVQVGVGGLGGAATVAGGAGTNSHISFSPVLGAGPNMVLSANGTNQPGGGGAGTNGSPGSAGTVPDVYTGATINGSIGIYTSAVGLVGGAGGAVAGGAGTSITAWAALPLSPGAGGGGAAGTNNNGGAQTATAATNFVFINWPNTAGALAAGGTGGTTAARNGNAGVSLMAPFFQTGGSGGGTNVSGVGGDGGRGGIGCGGGGGGKGTTGGRGGNGGNGLVAIFSW